MNFQDQLRAIIRGQRASPITIGKAAGIDKSAISRFMNGGRLTMDKIDRLTDTLGLRITATKTVPVATIGRPRKNSPSFTDCTQERKDVSSESQRSKEVLQELSKHPVQEASRKGNGIRGHGEFPQSIDSVLIDDPEDKRT